MQKRGQGDNAERSSRMWRLVGTNDWQIQAEAPRRVALFMAVIHLLKLFQLSSATLLLPYCLFSPIYIVKY